MDLRPLPADEAAIGRYVEELWLPYHRELEATVDAHALADDEDVVAREVESRLDRHESDSYRVFVAVEPDSGTTPADGGTALAGELAGFVAAVLDEAPPVFDRPDRLFVTDVYVREEHRGTGLARDLLEHAAEWGRETGCTEIALDVDVGNDRAVAFYEKLGFEPYRRELTLPIEAL